MVFPGHYIIHNVRLSHLTRALLSNNISFEHGLTTQMFNCRDEYPLGDISAMSGTLIPNM
jgi:hypothetical protein